MILLKHDEDFFRLYTSDISNYNGDLSSLGKSIILHESESLIKFLQDIILFENGVTFGDFLKLIFRDWMKYDLVFSSSIGQASLQDFVNEFNKESDLPVGLETAIVYIGYDPIWVSSGDVDLTYYLDGGNLLASIIVPEEQKAYPLHSFPLNRIKDLPIIIDHTTKVIFEDNKNELSKLYFQDITVYDLLNCIFYGMSFNGTPEQRAAKNTLNHIDEIEKKEDKQNKTSINDILKKLNIKPMDED